jgi:hypothetical protein
MRIIFGVLSLLVVLAIVGTLGKKQLQALNSGTVTTRASTAAKEAGIELPPPVRATARRSAFRAGCRERRRPTRRR